MKYITAFDILHLLIILSYFSIYHIAVSSFGKIFALWKIAYDKWYVMRNLSTNLADPYYSPTDSLYLDSVLV